MVIKVYYLCFFECYFRWLCQIMHLYASLAIYRKRAKYNYTLSTQRAQRCSTSSLSTGSRILRTITRLPPLYCILLRVDLRSDEFPSYLEPYLHEKTSQFIHEFISFAASPFDMIAYDQNVSYDWPDSHPEHDVNERREDAAQGGCACCTAVFSLVGLASI